MKKTVLLFAPCLALLIAAGWQINDKVSDENLVVSRSAVYAGRMPIACSPDWSLLNEDSLGMQLPPLPGWGRHHWDIKANHDSAQFYFDQGINLYFGFHIIESMASFSKAATFDSENPMIYWGKALAYGPNINDVEYQAAPEALDNALKAVQHSSKADAAGKALIHAMAVRYSKNARISRTKLNADYAGEMKKVYDKYGQLPDVATLYADALMLQHPWQYWKKDGSPEAWTPEIVRILEKTLQRDPEHPGSNHYYIHMVEASPDPARAMASADRLVSLMPGVAHMVHMPSHIYIRTGHYQKGINVNVQAFDAYQTYKTLYPGVQQNAALYLIHNQHMKAACALMLSDYAFAAKAAEELESGIDTSFLSLPAPYGNYAQYLYMTPLFAKVWFGRWQEINESPEPSKKHVFAQALHLFGRGMAQVAGITTLEQAKKSLFSLKKLTLHPSLQVKMYPFNKPSEQLKVAEWILSASIAAKEGRLTEAAGSWQKAIKAEDMLIYNEPKDWLLPARYFAAKHYFSLKEYNKAEGLLKQDLAINPGNALSLSLLGEIYSLTERWKEMEMINQQMKESAN